MTCPTPLATLYGEEQRPATMDSVRQRSERRNLATRAVVLVLCMDKGESEPLFGARETHAPRTGFSRPFHDPYEL